MKPPRASSRYLLLWGLALVVLGVGSLIVHPDFATGNAVTAKRFLGAFETNGWHGVAGLGLGVLALASHRSDRWAPTVTLVVAVAGGIVPAVMFAFTGDGGVAVGLVPVDLADAVTLHLVPGIVGVACAAYDLRSRRGLRKAASAV